MSADCLSEEQLELLHRGETPWLRGLCWRHHAGRCPRCRDRLERLRADEGLLRELRELCSAGHAESPLSAARSRSARHG